MRVVFLNQYYPPDAAPTGVMLEAVAAKLASEGHEVTVICASGGYAGGEKRQKTEDTREETEERFAPRQKTEDGREKTEEGGQESGDQGPFFAEATKGRPMTKDSGDLAFETLAKQAADRRAAGADQGPRTKGQGTSNIEHRTSNIEHRTSNIENEPGTKEAARPRIIRIGATRFGRGSVLGKLIDYASYYVGVAWKLGTMRPAPDRIVALTTPPYLSVLARLMSKVRGGTHAHWVMDIYPDVMVAHGMLREGGLFHRVLAWLARWGMGGKRCAVVLTLGPCMAERLRRNLKIQTSGFTPRPGEALRSRIHPSSSILEHVPLWSGAERAVDDAEVKSLRTVRGWAADEVVVMYSGNMGLGHRFTELFDVIKELSRSAPGKFRFVFFGKGRRRGEVESFLRDNPGLAVELHDYVEEELLGAHLRSADIHVVSLDPAWSGTMLPSKLQGVFAAGRPVIYIGGDDSSMARWVRESGAGRVVGANDAGNLQSVLIETMDMGIRGQMGASALRFALEHFAQKQNVEEMAIKLTRI